MKIEGKNLWNKRHTKFTNTVKIETVKIEKSQSQTTKRFKSAVCYNRSSPLADLNLDIQASLH